MKQRTQFTANRFTASALFAATLALTGATAAAAATQEAPVLRADAASSYTVQRGDTLWGISGRFLRDPWRWPEVWKGNPQIRNPHLIYPGDEVYLTEVAGRPALKVRRRRGGLVKLSPRVRSSPLEEAITTVPLEAINQFLVRPAIVDQATYESMPYIVSVGREALLASAGSRIYVRGIDDESQTRFGIFRRGRPFIDPDQDGEVIGFETLRVGEALLDEVGDPSRLVVTRPLREVLAGDRLMPLRDDQLATRFEPRAPVNSPSGRIISLVEAVAQVGQLQMVVLNIGAQDGVESGYVYRIMGVGETVTDPAAELSPRPADDNAPARIELDPAKQGGMEGFAQAFNRAGSALGDRLVRTGERMVGIRSQRTNVKLPDEPIGLVMVIQPFEQVSYALVMESVGAIRVNDRVSSPAE